MFSIAAIRNRVIARLTALRNFSEDAIHESYSREISTELDALKIKASALESLLKERMSHPKDGWVKFEREDLTELRKRLADFVSTAKYG